MSRSLFLSVVGILILSSADTVDAQRFRNRNNDCGCQANSQQYYRPNQANYQRYQANYQPNHQAVAVRRNYVAAQRVPTSYYQQNAQVNYRNVQNPRLQYQPRPQAQLRPMVQYSATGRCWVPVQNQFVRSQYMLVPTQTRTAGQSSAAGNLSGAVPSPAAEPANIQPATFEAPIESSTPPLAAPESNPVADPVAEPIPTTDPPATSILDHGT